MHKLLSVMQKGDNAALLETKKKEMEVKRAAAASKVAKVFYKITVKVRFQCMKRCGTEMPCNNCATFSLDVSPILSLGLDNVSGFASTMSPALLTNAPWTIRNQYQITQFSLYFRTMEWACQTRTFLTC